MWAKSFLFAKAPALVVEKWLTDEPATQGKYVLIEFWATWCPPCRKSIPKLNEFHQKFPDGRGFGQQLLEKLRRERAE